MVVENARVDLCRGAKAGDGHCGVLSKPAVVLRGASLSPQLPGVRISFRETSAALEIHRQTVEFRDLKHW